MAIHLTWDNDEQTVLRCSFDREWTWDEMDATLREVQRITDSADHEIPAIIDLSNGVSIPGSIFSPNTINQAKKMLKMGETEGRRAPVIVVGASSLIRTVYNTVRGLDAEGLSNVSFANTLEEARATLASRHPTA
jgi:alanine-alpha-ketoisovalerate/valine-pyruvate aminotransferase